MYSFSREDLRRLTLMNLAKAYTPNEFEPNIYALWEQSGVFNPKGEGEPYAIVMPPPNANGNLHVGHALSFDLEDILSCGSANI